MTELITIDELIGKGSFAYLNTREAIGGLKMKLKNF